MRRATTDASGPLDYVWAESPFSSRFRFSNSFWRMALLTTACAIGAASQADAAIFWSDSNSGFSQPAPSALHRRKTTRRHSDKKSEVAVKEAAKPQGPLVISISIEKQHMKIYDANGLFAESPVSTGMRGHLTPMGVFSVIQKQKMHHSNIYSGAPMPFMQRITWSGIAIHAGVLPGYPASHGCIRMPMAFAVKMYGWTKMGARVVVTPGEMSPVAFSHELLAAQKIAPQPVAAVETKTQDTPREKADLTSAKSDKASFAETNVKPASSAASTEPTATVGNDNGLKTSLDEPSRSVPLSEQTHTADAGDLQTVKSGMTLSDAAPSGRDSSLREQAPVTNENAAPAVREAAPVKSADASKQDVKPASAETSQTVALDSHAEQTKSVDVAAVQSTAEAATAEKTEQKIDQKPVQPGIETKAAQAEVAKPDLPASSDKPAERMQAAKDSTPDLAAVKKDEGRLPEGEKAAAAKPDLTKADTTATATPKRTGQIAVFISRKDSKLYVRQNFAPLFDAQVTIAPSDRPLGTHVFTAQVDNTDANALHWSVVSLPTPSRSAERRDEDERASRRRKMAGAIEIKTTPVPDSPAEALDRISIPADVMARVNEALTTGGSIIVSDQGITAGETGEGTDFIVSLR
jgi:hypothetical protein